MSPLRLYLAACIIGIAAYTSVVIANHGMGLMPIFFGDIAAMTWPGQFNLDFLGFLLLSGLWVSWRHQFSPGGLALGLIAVFGGTPFLSAYLLFHSFKTKGDIKALLLGEARARQS
ncbi:hypothetical protein EUV02_04970 [Polymorphobacter arshaanensis]|uniref:DUF2834 domain-containing protein n=1 Tax=Glacieibacterium arshaanense TaxID=2511025 RepID=A0A4Y9ERT5_9SPHN|nr:hypothetical protein [Polymorphobacter arshaanensis]TFU06347.1 hypothetical protein EUV02_04970 [Polymorphobacter arshaanensis]